MVAAVPKPKSLDDRSSNTFRVDEHSRNLPVPVHRYTRFEGDGTNCAFGITQRWPCL
jgi:hypothetical protein